MVTFWNEFFSYSEVYYYLQKRISADREAVSADRPKAGKIFFCRINSTWADRPRTVEHENIFLKSLFLLLISINLVRLNNFSNFHLF